MQIPLRPSTFKEDQFQDIIQYYDQTQFDYRVAWIKDENLGLHFGFYDENASKHHKALNNTNRVLSDLVDIKAGDRILDAGCGQGGSSFWLVRNKSAEVIGITPVQSQVEICREKAIAFQLQDRTAFLQADYCDTPFEDNSFDLIWACESVCHASEKKRFYEEAYRLLKPGGQLVMAEYLRNARPLAPKAERLLHGWLRRWAIPDIDTAAEHIAHAKAVGFEKIDIQDATTYTWVSLKNLHKISWRWIWIGVILRGLGIRSKVQHGNQVGSIKQFQALQSKLWFYATITAKKG